MDATIRSRHKHRLYLSLQHRGALPGFHWALLLTPHPSRESTNTQTHDSHVVHATNALPTQLDAHVDQGVDGKMKVPWRYEHLACHNMRDGTVLARVLVAKLPRDVSIDAWVGRIDAIVRTVPVVQDDPGWTCRVWALHALAALRAHGDAFATVPEVEVKGAKEEEIKAFGERARKELREGKGAIRRAADLPCVDMRVRPRR